MVQPTTRPPKTLEDYLALPDDVRAELIGGELYVMQAPSMDHQRVVLALVRALADHADGVDYGEVVVSPVDVFLPSGDIVQPDIVIVPNAQADLCQRNGIHGAPEVLIEVLSPTHSERDRIVKLRLYEQNGVAEYWMVDPETRSVEVFALEEGGFEPRGWFTQDARLASPALPDLELIVSRLFPA